MKIKLVPLLLLMALALESHAQSSVVPGEESATRAIRNGILIPEPAPDRQRGEGPFDSLIIENVMLVSGEGAPPRGPVSIVIKEDRIQSISSVP
ncbi:MAG: hypothetical protein ACJA2D_002863, partial [Pseudohongiellaceae bacterium]